MKQTTREWSLMHRKLQRTAARKFNAPVRGVHKSQADMNRPVIEALEAKARAAKLAAVAA